MREKVTPVKKAASSKKSWREFELLVSRTEQVLSPKGAKVKSPDYLIDKVTGEPREVDATLRYKIGTSEIIITIECRERVSVQDTLWIEQLATKQMNIGASKTIAVTSSRFTAPAIKKAKMLGIELRILSKIDDDIILKWKTLTRIQFHYKIVGGSISLDCSEDIMRNIKSELNPLINFDKPLFLFNRGRLFLSLRDLFEDSLGRAKQAKIEIPETGETGRYKLEQKYPKGTVTYSTPYGNYDLLSFVVKYTLYNFEEIIATSSPIFEYTDTEKSLIQGIEFVIEYKSGQKELVTIHTDLKAGTEVLCIWADNDKKE